MNIIIWAGAMAVFAMVLWILWPVTIADDDIDWDI